MDESEFSANSDPISSDFNYQDMSGGLINFNVLGEKALSFRWNDLLKRIDDIVLRLLIDDDKV